MVLIVISKRWLKFWMNGSGSIWLDKKALNENEKPCLKGEAKSYPATEIPMELFVAVVVRENKRVNKNKPPIRATEITQKENSIVFNPKEKCVILFNPKEKFVIHLNPKEKCVILLNPKKKCVILLNPKWTSFRKYLWCARRFYPWTKMALLARLLVVFLLKSPPLNNSVKRKRNPISATATVKYNLGV